VWAVHVVVVAPGVQRDARVWQRAEERLVEKLIAQASVEAFAEGVLLRLAGWMYCQPTPRSSAHFKMHVTTPST
jgi:hypothetical protein